VKTEIISSRHPKEPFSGLTLYESNLLRSGPVRDTPRAPRFSLAANYDPELVPQLAGYPVDEVYGKFPTDGVSGGRPVTWRHRCRKLIC